MLQQVAELGGLGDAQVDADARVCARPRAGGAEARDALDLLEPGEQAGEGLGLVVVATMSMSLTLSASRRAQPASSMRASTAALSRRPAMSASPSSIALGSSSAGAGARAPRRPASAAEHALLELRAQPAHGAQPLCERGRAQRLERVDAQLGVQQARALGPQAGQARDRDQAGREPRAQLLAPPGSRRSRRARGSSPAASRRCRRARWRCRRAPARPPTRRPRARRARRCGRPARGARSRRRARRGRPAPPARRRSWRWKRRALLVRVPHGPSPCRLSRRRPRSRAAR